MIIETMISLRSYRKLIIFSFILLFASCQETKDTNTKDVSIIWTDGRATALSIPKNLVENILEDSLSTQVQVRLAKDGEQPFIVGEYAIHKNEIIFEPLIPFTRGLRYEVLVKHLAPIILEIPRATEQPKLLAVYPTEDTLPENLLKIYLVFSHPMLKEHSLQYIKLLNEKGDSLPHIFLNLQQELWNEDGTVLTLWLDPGRIKRDLHPNLSLGPPLLKGEKYKLVISSEWPDVQGASLTNAFTKNIVAAAPDTRVPAPNEWKLEPPKEGTTQALTIDLQESHDYFLLQNTIRLIDPEGKLVKGTVQITDNEKKYSFVPVKAWSRGKYKLQIEPQLEDLAGNNLSRLFDRDLRTTEKNTFGNRIYEREWEAR